jgi:Flp pilus assembly protein CpaB
VLRLLYLSAFAILSTAAGVFYYSETRQATVLVASQDLLIGSRVEDTDITLRQVNPASVPTGTLTTPEEAVGRFVSFPVLKGQFLDGRHLTSVRNAQALTGGLGVPRGYRIIGLPISPAAGVGGTLKPGDFVDVLAIPSSTRAVGGLDEGAGVSEVIGKRVMVVGLRTDQGGEVDSMSRLNGLTASRLATVLLAIPERDEAKYSAALASSTFFLALAID